MIVLWYSGTSMLLTHHNDTLYLLGRCEVCELANGKIIRYTYLLIYSFFCLVLFYTLVYVY